MLTTAKQFYKYGFAIHWLKEKSKAPIESKWTTGPRKDWATLKGAYKKGMNVGVRLGQASQIGAYFLSVIDCDVKSKNEKYLAEMNLKLAQLIGTDLVAPTVLSGRGNGSKHIYILTEKPIAPFRFSQCSTKVKVKMPSVEPSKFEKQNLKESELKKGIRLRPAWEISVMGQGQQVVLPPSVHPDSGKPYVWEKPFDIESLTLISIDSSKASQKIERSKDSDFEFEDVDLLDTSLDDEILSLIVDGEDCEDRSAALFKASRAMVLEGMSDRQILSVLTDRENFLGETGYDHAKTESRKRAARWVNDFTLKKVRNELSADKLFEDTAELEPLTDEEAIEQKAELVGDRPWHLRLQRNQQDGGPKSNFHNIKLILENTLVEKFVAYNEFAVTDNWVLDCPWGSKKGNMVNDVDCVHIKDWLIHKFRLDASTALINEVITKISHDNKFHPVRNYLRALEWDGRPRVRDWLTDYLDAHDQKQEYLRELGPLILVGMVARIFEPGTKFDWVPILEGRQGVGKSTTPRILAGDEWFSDTTLNLGDKDAVMNLQGIWVVELGELSVMSRHDANSLKEFVARTVDKIRPPYGQRTMAFPRQCIFVGTTNRDQYLKDDTGARRFMPVKVGEVEMTFLRKDREQLLAEAVDLYLNGYSIGEHGKRCEELAAPENEKRMEYDEIESQLEEFLKTESEFINKDCFRISDLISHANLEVKNDRQSQMRIGMALKKIGYRKVEKMVGGIRGCWWNKPE